ncbi:MAG: phage portal protein [bacterium]|nr:phage portal protein [bacterium]
MGLRAVTDILHAAGRFDPALIDGWAAEQAARAEKVALFRDYIAGDHPQDLTDAMRRMMRVNAHSPIREFCLNYMEIVVQAVADRLRVTGFACDDESARVWAADRLARSSFDGMQGDVHEAALTDGDTYVLAYFDPAARAAKWSHEPAFDGVNGVLALYESATQAEPSAAIKVWQVGDRTRINAYYPDRVERYVTDGDHVGGYETLDQPAAAAWTGRDGSPLGVPLVHFRNRARRWGAYGASEIETAIPVQNALNRTLYSMVMAAELTAFQIRYAVGWEPPAEVSPGMWLTISPNRPLQRDEQIQVGTLSQGELMPYLDMARYLATEIGRITRTPSPEFGWDAASAESLRQRESGLLGKARRFQTRAGEAWARCLAMGGRIERAFGTGGAPPEGMVYRPQWASLDVHNDSPTA